MNTKYSGPFEMPKNMTLLSIANGDGTETLGVKTGESVIDVRKAAQLLNLPAALTLDQLLQEGSAGQLQKLVDAVKSKMDAGLDVRIIMSQYEAQGGALEQLKGLGFNMSLIKIQLNLHAKGFIIDSNVVALGSQNWSDEGTQTNRDATLIIRHAGVARYFEQIFMHDWTTMAHQKVGL